MGRGLFLYILSFKSLIHKMKHDLAKELVVAVCAAVVLGLFSYIFNDFINVEVKKVSSKMRDAFALWMSYGLFALAAILSPKRFFNDLRSSRSFGEASRFLGESPNTIHLFRAMVLVGDVFIFFGGAVYISKRWFIALPLVQIVLLSLGLVAISLLIQSFAGGKKEDEGEKQYLADTGSQNATPLQTLYRWKFQILLFRSRLTRFTLLISFLPLFMIGALAAIGSSYVVAVLITFVGSIFVAAALSFQLADDLTYSWVEKAFGISHDQYLRSLATVGRAFGFVYGVWAFGIWFGFGYLKMPLSSLLLPSITIGVVGAVAPLVFHSLSFQIDARRPFVQILTVTLVCLFVDTAILAHPLGVILVPLLVYYGNVYQKGSFYRA